MDDLAVLHEQDVPDVHVVGGQVHRAQLGVAAAQLRGTLAFKQQGAGQGRRGQAGAQRGGGGGGGGEWDGTCGVHACRPTCSARAYLRWEGGVRPNSGPRRHQTPGINTCATEPRRNGHIEQAAGCRLLTPTPADLWSWLWLYAPPAPPPPSLTAAPPHPRTNLQRRPARDEGDGVLPVPRVPDDDALLEGLCGLIL